MNKKQLFLVLAALATVVAAAGAVFFSLQADTDGSGSEVALAAAQGSPAVTDINYTGPVGETPAVTEAQPATSAPSLAGAPEKRAIANPKTRSSLSDLAAVMDGEGSEAARRFAEQRGLKYGDGRVQVVIEANDPAAAAAAVTAVGGLVETANDGLVQASVPVPRLEDIAASAAVEYVREPKVPALAALSEGVADIGADAWHGAGGDGAGVKVAVIDLGFQGYQDLISAGELPAGLTTASFRGDGDITGGGETHGSACAEIVYDIAPGAQYYLINFTTDVELANAIDYVIAQDIDVVSASWTFFGEFRGNGEGPINDLVQSAHDSGAFWSNVAGNAAEDHWGGSYTDNDGDGWHEYVPGDETNDLNVAAGTVINVYLTWDRWPVTDQDYDMYLYHESNPDQPVAASDGYQGGSQTPTEHIYYTVPPGKSGRYSIKIKNYSAAGDANLNLLTYPLHLEHQVAASSLAGQPADSPYAMTVGAVPVNGTALEVFSSRGPTLDGRTKPDIVAPDRITTITFGPSGFWGTSASAPHAAGAGALVKQVHPGFTPAQVMSYLEARATDLGAPGKDNLYGSGKLDLGPLPDQEPPVITSVMPSGDLDAEETIISVDYGDTGSGIDAGSVAVTLDGILLAGCTVTATNASCPVGPLQGGAHVIGGSVADNEGNITPISGSFTVTCFQPSLSLDEPRPFWASYQDYVIRELSITYAFCNEGANDAAAITTVGSESTNGVILVTDLPLLLGDLLRGVPEPNCIDITYRYLVPFGVESFKTTTYVTASGPCDGSYYYPGPYVGPGN